MLHHIGQRLVGHAEEQSLALLVEAGGGGGVDLDGDAPGAGGRGQILQRRGEPGVGEARRVDVDEERAEAAQPRADGGGDGAQIVGERGVAVGSGPLAPAVHGEGRGHEILHGAVVHGRGDAPPLVGRRVESALQQRLAVPPRPPDDGEQPGEHGQQEEHQQHGARERDRGEAAPELGAAVDDLVVAEVALEEQRRPRRCPDRAVRLEQALAVALVHVLGRLQIRHLGVHVLVLEGFEILLVERERTAGQPGVVGVEDPAARVPQLHPHQRVVENVGSNLPVDGVDRGGIAGQDPVGDRRLHDHLGEQIGGAGGVGHRLGFGETARGLHLERTEGDHDHERDGDHSREQPPGPELGLARPPARGGHDDPGGIHPSRGYQRRRLTGFAGVDSGAARPSRGSTSGRLRCSAADQARSRASER
ncbi:hypothetical protein Q0F99_14150 [Rathayibacter oskolensis]|nr:hypothetical protein [Rathayibacter oskolensis]WKK70880.1 hypothetical protein Q0F99_14150 [Rathayibacter oskolensis]